MHPAAARPKQQGSRAPVRVRLGGGSIGPVLGLITRPLKALLDAAGAEVSAPLVDTEREVLDGVHAIRAATDSIEHHVEVIESLATSVGPLAESVDRLTTTLNELLQVLGPLAAVERDLGRAEHGVERLLQLGRRQRRDEGG